MTSLQNGDILTLVLLLALGIVFVGFLSSWSLRRYEIAIVLLLLSPWAHWVFAKNIPIDSDEMAAGPASYIRIGGVLLSGIMGCLYFIRARARSNERLSSSFILFAAFLFFALLSTTYSIDKYYTFVRASEFVALFCFLLGLYYWLKDKSRLNTTLRIYYIVMTIGILINAASIALLPDRAWHWAAPSRFQGLMGDPNSFGAFCMMTYPALMWRYRSSTHIGKLWNLLLFSITIAIHIMSGSRASLGASILGFFVWHLVLDNAAKLYIIGAMVFFFGILLLGMKLPSYQREVGTRITHLTGRPKFWLGCLRLAAERPIHGYGYGVGGKVWSDPRYHDPQSLLWSGSPRSSLHNAYLSIAIGTGIVGLAMWVSIVSFPIRHIAVSKSSVHKVFMMVTIFQALLISCFEAGLSSSGSQVSLAFWIVWVSSMKLWLLHPKRRFLHETI